MDLVLKVKETIEKHKLILPGELVIVGVSGGSDSLALLHILNRLKEELHFRLHVAHLDHSFRGREAEEEALWVKKTAQQWGLNCTIEKVDVPSLIQSNGLSPQDAGHRVRKKFFLTLAADLNGQKVALGHQADDQAETLLMHFLTGSGPEGLTGIRPGNFPFIRPLIYILRKDIEEYCLLHKLNPRKDPSNQKNIYLRNKIRNKILPLLQEEVNLNLVETLNRTAQIFQAEEKYWQTITEENAGNYCLTGEGFIKLLLAQWKTIHPAVQRRLIRHSYQLIRNSQGLGFLHVEEVRKLADNGQPGKILHLPDRVKVEKTYDCLIFSDLDYSGSGGTLEVRRLIIPGITSVPEKNLIIRAELVNEIKESFDLSSLAVIPFKDKIPELWARSRRPGDRLSPQGLKGSKKLKEYFIDKKIPRGERDRILLVAEDDEVLWIPGIAVSARVNRIETDSSYILLKVQPVKGDES